MMLGDLVTRLGDENFAAETLLALDSLPLLVEVESAAKDEGLGAGAYTTGAVRRFASGASDADWLALMTALGHAPEAGLACLRHMIEWSLRQRGRADGCGGDRCTCKGAEP